jgi:hypothetical protein
VREPRKLGDPSADAREERIRGDPEDQKPWPNRKMKRAGKLASDIGRRSREERSRRETKG